MQTDLFYKQRVPITISRPTMLLPFEGCSEDYIRNVCHGRCCESSVPGGGIIPVLQHEVAPIVAKGGTVADGLMVTLPDRASPGGVRCPFHGAEGFCGIHLSGEKPFSCHASPWMLNAKDTLLVRNRYKRLCCFKAPGSTPAYQAFRGPLVRLLGLAEYARVSEQVEAGTARFTATMPAVHYRWLKTSDSVKHAVAAARSNG